MTKIVICLILTLFVFVLARLPVFTAGKQEKAYRKQGMQILCYKRNKIVLMPALGLFIFCFLLLFSMLAIADGAWEAGVGMLAMGTAMLLLCFAFGYLMRSRHVLFNDEVILVGRPFGGYERVPWYEITSMEIVNPDLFILLGRGERKLVQADSEMEGYQEFYIMASRHCHPSQAAAAGKGTAYQRKYAMPGKGRLRCEPIPFYLLLGGDALLIALLVKAFVTLEGSMDVLITFFTQDWKMFLIALLFGVLAPLGSLWGIIYYSLQKIDLNSQEILFSLFPHRAVTVLWREVRRIEALRTGENNLMLTFYTDKGKFEIRQQKFRKGFAENLPEILKNAERYEIPVIRSRK